MGRKPDYVNVLHQAERGGLTGRVNSANQTMLNGGLPVGLLGVAGAAFAGVPEMALLSGAAGVTLTAVGGMGYAATLPRTRGIQAEGRKRLQAFEPVEDGEDVLTALDRGDIDAARYTTNVGFDTQDADFALDPETVEEADPYRVLERMEENGDPTYLLREDGYQFTLAAVNTPYWNASRYRRTGSIEGSGNYEILEICGDRKESLGLETEPVTAEENMVDAYVESTFS